MNRPFPGSFRSRKKLSLDGTVAGIEFNRARGEYAEMPVNLGRPGAAPADYLGPVPQSYDSYPGFAVLPESDFTSCEKQVSD